MQLCGKSRCADSDAKFIHANCRSFLLVAPIGFHDGAWWLAPARQWRRQVSYRDVILPWLMLPPGASLEPLQRVSLESRRLSTALVLYFFLTLIPFLSCSALPSIPLLDACLSLSFPFRISPFPPFSRALSRATRASLRLDTLCAVSAKYTKFVPSRSKRQMQKVTYTHKRQQLSLSKQL